MARAKIRCYQQAVRLGWTLIFSKMTCRLEVPNPKWETGGHDYSLWASLKEQRSPLRVFCSNIASWTILPIVSSRPTFCFWVNTTDIFVDIPRLVTSGMRWEDIKVAFTAQETFGCTAGCLLPRAGDKVLHGSTDLYLCMIWSLHHDQRPLFFVASWEKRWIIYVCVFATMKQVQLLLLRLYFMRAR